MKFDIEIQNRIESVLESSDYGLCLTEVAKEAKTTRITARKHLERLRNSGILQEFNKGRLRIFRKQVNL